MPKKVAEAKTRRAFTLTELLVVIAIIGLLLSLVLSAIQKTRETARKLQCGNNLKQQGIALHVYHEFHGQFPPGNIFSDVGWFHSNTNALIFPYIEQQNLRNRMTTGRPWFAQTKAAQSTPVGTFVCPSDAVENPIYSKFIDDLPFTHTGLFAVSSYGQSSGINDAPCLSDAERRQGHRLTNESGMFGFSSTVRIVDVKDGLSNTFAIGEVASGKEICSGVGCTVVTPEVRELADIKAAHPLWIGGTSWFGWEGKWYYSGSLATAIEPLNKRDSSLPATDSMFYSLSECTPSHRGGRNWMTNFRSSHVGGGYFLMGDGSVRFISHDIDQRSYRALSTIKGGAQQGFTNVE